MQQFKSFFFFCLRCLLADFVACFTTEEIWMCKERNVHLQSTDCDVKVNMLWHSQHLKYTSCRRLRIFVFNLSFRVGIIMVQVWHPTWTPALSFFLPFFFSLFLVFWLNPFSIRLPCLLLLLFVVSYVCQNDFQHSPGSGRELVAFSCSFCMTGCKVSLILGIRYSMNTFSPCFTTRGCKPFFFFQ